jgi:hypothetical protein
LGYANTNYVNEGQANSITNSMIVDGSITINDIDTTSFDSRFVNENQANSITNNMIVDNSITNLDIDPATVQRRVTGTCAVGSTIRVINQDGTVVCQDDDARYVNEGQADSINSAMIVTDSITAADIGANAVGTNEVDANQVQRRVASTCPAGQSIRAIDNAGGVTCEVDDVGASMSPSVTSEMILTLPGGDADCTETMSLGIHDFCMLTYDYFWTSEEQNANYADNFYCHITHSGSSWTLTGYQSNHWSGCLAMPYQSYCGATCVDY